MKIKLDEQGYVEAWVSLGDMEGGVESALTEEDMLVPHIDAYKLVDDVLIKDEIKYAELVAAYRPIEEEVIDNITEELDREYKAQLVEEIVLETNLTPEEVLTKLSIKEKLELAMTSNRAYLDITGPTDAQIRAQVKDLTRQNIRIIRFLLKNLDGTE